MGRAKGVLENHDSRFTELFGARRSAGRQTKDEPYWPNTKAADQFLESASSKPRLIGDYNWSRSAVCEEEVVEYARQVIIDNDRAEQYHKFHKEVLDILRARDDKVYPIQLLETIEHACLAVIGADLLTGRHASRRVGPCDRDWLYRAWHLYIDPLWPEGWREDRNGL